MATGQVRLGSDLERKKWMREGLVQSASKSFWSPLTGTTPDSVVYQAKNETAGDGHTVVFDFSGNLSGRARKGKETAAGTGEQKKKFSSKITVERYRLVADNGDVFDGANIGDLTINQHTDSRSKLGDLFVRFKDQAIFDAAQGLLTTNQGIVQTPTHIIDLGTTFTWNTLVDIEKTLKTSTGFTTGGVRRPLVPYQLANGEPVWLYVIDAAMASILRKDTAGYQNVMKDADVRGGQNSLIKGVIGKIGSLLIVEAPNYFGYNQATGKGFGLNDSEIEISGLRQYDGADPATALWTGQEGFSYSSANLHSRGLILGAGALQLAFGKQPDYKFKESQDFGITAESAVEFWMEVQKTILTAETADYKAAKIAGIDYGVVATDLEVQ